MTYFGVSYAADEVIDTSGWSDSAVVRLMRHAPVYFVPAGGGDASEPLNSYAQLENHSSTTLPSDGTPVTVPMDMDTVVGTDISISGDGVTVSIKAGMYWISGQFQTSTGHSVTKVRAQPHWDGAYPVAGNYGQSWNDDRVPASDGGVVDYGDIFKFNADTTFHFQASATSSTDSAVSWFGVDVLKIA